jgi:hypothetical protein
VETGPRLSSLVRACHLDGSIHIPHALLRIGSLTAGIGILQLTIQGVPKRSLHMPKRCAQKVSCMGCVTCPPSAGVLKPDCAGSRICSPEPPGNACEEASWSIPKTPARSESRLREMNLLRRGICHRALHGKLHQEFRALAHSTCNFDRTVMFFHDAPG